MNSMLHSRKRDWLVVSCIFLAFLTVVYVAQMGAAPSTPLCSVRSASLISVVELFVIICSWRVFHGRFLSPSFIAIVALFLVVCGQSLMWSVGLYAGYRDLIQSPDWGFTEYDLVRGLLYSQLCVFVMYISVVACAAIGNHGKKHDRLKKRLSAISAYRATLLVAFLLLFVCIGPYLSDFCQTYEHIKQYGYDRAYDYVEYGFDSLSAKIGAFLPAAVIMIMFCWGRPTVLNKKGYFGKALVCYALVGLVLAVSLALGRRTNLVLFALAILFIWFKDKKMPRSMLLLLVLAGVVGMAIMRLIDLCRSGSLTDFGAYFSYFASIEDNPIVDFLGDIGWNLLSTIEVQMRIPALRGFDGGLTYLISLTSAIPNLGFWDIHPASQYGMPSDWLQSSMGLSYGVGFSPVAEAWFNFGVFGPAVFIVWGLVLAQLDIMFDDEGNPAGQLASVLFIGIVAKSFVRSCFAAVFRPLLLYVILLPLLVYLVGGEFDLRKEVVDESWHHNLVQGD